MLSTKLWRLNWLNLFMATLKMSWNFCFYFLCLLPSSIFNLFQKYKTKVQSYLLDNFKNCLALNTPRGLTRGERQGLMRLALAVWLSRTCPLCNRCVYLCTCAQSCPALCGLMDGSSPGSSVRGISQARIRAFGDSQTSAFIRFLANGIVCDQQQHTCQ